MSLASTLRAVGTLALRQVSPNAVFTLSHVHVPAAPSSATAVFEKGARWVLPRCRTRESSNGQAYEHLHKSATPLAGKAPYTYAPDNYGFEPRNYGRDLKIKVGLPEAGEVVEPC